jgi:hypothetical protein
VSEKSSAATIKETITMNEGKWNESKNCRCDNAKEQMAPLKDMFWANGILVEYVATYTPQKMGK